MKRIGGTSDMVGRVNRDLVQNALRAAAPDGLSVSELSRATGLSVATCANLAKTLSREGRAVELPAESQGGRPARRYGDNPDYGLVALVILRALRDGGEILRAVRNGDNRTLSEGRETRRNIDPENVAKVLKQILSRHPAVKAAAVSIPGIVSEGVVGNCDLPWLSGHNLEAILTDALGIPVVAENDMSFAAVGYYGKNAPEIGSALAYSVFPGDVCPGMGLVVGGHLIKGKSDFAGEISNIPWERSAAKGRRRNRDDLIRRIVAVAISVAAVVNPDVFVVNVPSPDAALEDEVRARCLERIPERHLPRFVFQPDHGADSFDGMTAMALRTLSGDIKLVETERHWCD